MIGLVDAYKTYDNGTKALNGVNLEIADGEFALLWALRLANPP